LSEKKSVKKSQPVDGNDKPNSGARPAGVSAPMDVSLLERIVKLMRVNDLSEVDLRDGDKRVMLKRGSVVVQAPAGASHAGAPASVSGAPQAPAMAADETADFKKIVSPMVGTFYSAPSPDAKPFITVGSAVTDDTDVCVIEAMKVFNNVKAECQGTIAKILVTNGQAVEFNQVLFLVKP
jgi:acetyl-CoA carboxylase biotin carboxyl carrier protein